MTQHAAVIGSGPNGLTSACRLARAGWKVTVYEAGRTPGGAARSAELFGPGLISDLGASVFPFASPAYESMLGAAGSGGGGTPRASGPATEAPAFTPEATSGGIDYAYPPIPAAHPVKTGNDAADAVLLHRSLEQTADELGPDGDLWRWIIGPVVNNWEAVRRAFLSPPSRPLSGLQTTPERTTAATTSPDALRRLTRTLRSGVQQTAALAQIGALGLMPARNMMRSFSTQRARALFAGMAAHSTGPLTHPLTSAFGVVFGAAGHTEGWPVIRGGSQRLVDALTAELDALGGQIVTDFRVEEIREAPLPGLRPGIRKDLRPRGYRIEGVREGDLGRRRRAGEEVTDVVVLDLTPKQVLQLEGLRLPDSARRRMNTWRYGPGLVKIDYLVDGPIPWSQAELAQAGTVHLGGSATQITASESAANKGILPGRPFVLLTQPSAADDSRTPDHRTVCWAYAHVPNGLDAAGSARAAQLIETEISRYAPGFRDAVLDRKVWSPAELEQWNPNMVGGSVSAGLATLGQTFAGPASLVRSPYATGVEGVYMCSASTPPGGGAHGMAGYNAAASILRDTEMLSGQ
ncbi:phytoene desaturase family protein [Nesterenkonia muleiensis]|uniref:phytoene desaturase family protein n=1 Tax=Nesterenkonia muleiensis TaxID=2282648 RepID=UPI000E761F80|nr:NAD(P)/FAD-dependent oxidoreductase [Nesterenkonia muleiensis]